MKTKIFFLVAFLLVSSSILESCKKREQPRFRWDFKPFRTVHFIYTSTYQSYKSCETDIGNGRNTTGLVYTWSDGDTVALNGPAGYKELAKKALFVFKRDEKNDGMPDSTQLCQDGEIVRGMNLFLKELRDHDAGKAWNIIKLAIPRKLYKSCPIYWEKKLTATKDYYVSTIGGSSNSTNGTRDFLKELGIRNLIEEKIPEHNWGPNTTGSYLYERIFIGMAEGNYKSLPVGLIRDAEGDIVDVSMSMEDAQNIEAAKRFKMATEVKGYEIGTVDDYKTKFENDANGGYYYIELDVRQLKCVSDKPTLIEE